VREFGGGVTVRSAQPTNFVVLGANHGVLPALHISLDENDNVAHAASHAGAFVTAAKAQRATERLLLDFVRRHPTSSIAPTFWRLREQSRLKRALRIGAPPMLHCPRVRVATRPRTRRAVRRAVRPTARAPDPEPPSPERFTDFALLNGVPP
jgi:hypothetical protein